MSASSNPPFAPGASIGVVIVTYHSASVIRHCLQSLSNLPLRVVVVDNASADGTAEIARGCGATVIQNTTNRGFAAAANQGFQLLPEEFILLLNPDVALTPAAPKLLAAFTDQSIAAVVGGLTDPSGLPQTAFQFRRFPTPVTLLAEILGVNRLIPENPVNSRYRYRDADWQTPRDVEQPAGAFLLIRRTVWEQLGGFDELFYPLWFEDVDFCLRLAHAGWRIRYLPERVGIHEGAHSIRDLEPAVRQLYWYRSLLRYAQKHFSTVWVRLLAASVVAALGGKAALMALRWGQIRNAVTVWPAMRMAVRTFIHGRHPSIGPGIA